MILAVVGAIAAAICIPLIYSYVYHLLELKKFPKGPFPWPIIGNLNLLTCDAHLDFAALSDRYGNVFSFSLGMRRVVIVNSIESIKEALHLKSEFFSGRPLGGYTNSLLTKGYISDYTPSQVFMKNAGHAALKVYKEKQEDRYCLQSIFEEESDELLARLTKCEGKPINVKEQFGLTVLNIIARTVFGERFEREDEDFIEISTINEMFFRLFNHGDLVAFVPWLKYFPLKAFSILHEFTTRRDRFFNKRVAEHFKSYDEHKKRDMIDAMISHYYEQSKKESPLISYEKIELTSAELYLAAFETTNATLCWMILYLLHWPKYQELIHDEIINVLGKDKYPTLLDMPKLHYAKAFVYETLRHSSIAPLGIPHESRGNSSLDGKNIPHGTYMLFNFWKANHDGRHWQKPLEFIPERWISDDGTFSARKYSSFIPYGTGKRSCLGEHVANNQMYVILTRLMKDFSIERYPDEPFPNFKRVLGVTLIPMNYNVLMKKRE